MNAFKQPTVTRSEFRRALNLRCHKELGVSLCDLPDIIVIDDNWWEEQTEKEALVMIDSCIEELKKEMGFTSFSVNAPLYSIDE
jgi:hypothetical protein